MEGVNEVATECVICGSHIIAGSYPPVCCEHCKLELEIECEFHKFAKEEMKKYDKKTT